MATTKQEALGILHGLEKFHHYYLAKEVCMIMDHKVLVAMINKDVATLSQQLQHIMLHIHQYNVHISCKPGPDLYIEDWLSKNNHTENKDQGITSMNVNMHAINTAVDILICTSIVDIQAATSQNADL